MYHIDDKRKEEKEKYENILTFSNLIIDVSKNEKNLNTEKKQVERKQYSFIHIHNSWNCVFYPDWSTKIKSLFKSK